MRINGVDFLEYAKTPPSPNQQYANDNGRITRVMRITGTSEDDRFAAAKALLGCQVVSTTASKKWINRSTGTTPGGQLPAFYPAVIDVDINPGGTPYMWCSNIPEIEMLGASEGIDFQGCPIYAGGALFHAEFNTRPFFTKPDSDVIAASGRLAGVPDEGTALASGWPNSRFVSRYLKPGSRTITLPMGFMFNNRTGTPVKQGLAFKEAIWTVKYTWFLVPIDGLPLIAMNQTLGCVNNDPFDFMSTGTALLSDVEIKQYYSGLGQILADVTYSMKYLPHWDTDPRDPPVVPPTYRGWNSYLQGDDTSVPGTRYMRYDWYTADKFSPPTTLFNPTTGLILSTNVAFPYYHFEYLFQPPQLPVGP